VTRELFGILPDGREITRFVLRNPRMEVGLISYGGTITSIRVPDGKGRLADVTLGHDTLEDYLEDSRWLGTLVGRYANRIAGGQFSLDGRDYTLERNNGPNHLHGGSTGFHRVLWTVETGEGAAGPCATLRHTSPAGEGGYPGTLDVRVTYTLTDDDELIFDYHATTDAPTHVNLTQHSYFNLAGTGAGDILDHELWLNARTFTPVDAELIPTGEIRAVEGTPFDFTTPARIGSRIDAADEQLTRCGGYDHNFLLDHRGEAGLSLAARLLEPRSGRTLTVLTTEPGLQLYSGNALETAARNFGRRAGLTLETQHFPDSPNHPEFPSTVLRPVQVFSSRTVYAFSAGRPGSGAINLTGSRSPG
jgi:aldose 1-epimerase